MKLLIVDDEELTRTGVISSIDWKAIGIDQILQADDGMNGLAVPWNIDRTLFFVMYVCQGWTESRCWKDWKPVFLT